jgi:hypothetical protein
VRTKLRAIAWGSVCVLVVGCSDRDVQHTPARRTTTDSGAPGAAPDPCGRHSATDGGASALVAEAGFIDVLPGASGPLYLNRLFYSFQPAERDASNAPLLVFFNGGPGAATTGMLLLYGTGPHTLDAAARPDTTALPNPDSFTRFANLLYLDAPQAGFSYGLLGDTFGACGDPSAPGYVWDAAAFVRALLSFMDADAHAALADNPVVLVGESYGGVRAPAMLYLLQQFATPANAQLEDFRAESATLRDAIGAHFNLAFSEGCRPTTPTEVASQFGWQALIEPVVFGDQQGDVAAPLLASDPDFAEYVACTTGPTCAKGSVDDYDVRLTVNDDLDIGAQGEAAVRDPAILSTLLGVPLETVHGLSAPDRADAFRNCCFGDDTLATVATREQALTLALGALSPRDAYWIPLENPCHTGDISYGAGVPTGRTFFDVLRRTNTFITRARYDAIAYPAAWPTLLRQSATYGAEAWDVSLITDAPEGAARPGVIQLATPESTRSIRFPTYEAGHEVTVTAGAAFGEDVEGWLRQTGALR